MKTFDEVLDEVMELDYDSREMLVDIIRKRQIEERRDEILRNVKSTRKEFVRPVDAGFGQMESRQDQSNHPL